MAFKLAGSIAMKQAMEQAGPALLEPIMLVTLTVPEESVGDVIGDLNSRRGRPLGMEGVGGVTEVKAEVPMAEMLSYAPDLRSITGGQGDYTMEFLRYEEVPAHLAQKVVESTQRGGRHGLRALLSAAWLSRRIARRRTRRSRAPCAPVRCCAGSAPTSSFTPASAAMSASSARRAPCTRAGSARARTRRPVACAAGHAARGASFLERLRQRRRDESVELLVPEGAEGLIEVYEEDPYAVPPPDVESEREPAPRIRSPPSRGAADLPRGSRSSTRSRRTPT